MVSSSELTPIRGLLAGDEQAHREVWAEHYARLRGVVARKLMELPQLVSKESDIAVQAMHQFLAGAVAGRFPQLTDQGAIWRLLRTIAIRKINDELKYAQAGKRGGAGTAPEKAGVRPPRCAGTVSIEQLQDRRTDTADDRIVVDDLFQHLLARLPDDLARRIILMRLQGSSSVEIAAQLGLSTRSVQRRLREIQAWWTTEFLAGPDAR